MMAQKPLCAHCRKRRVTQWAHVYCSKRCAWEARGGRALALRSLPKANAARRAKYVARLRARLTGLSAAQAWAAGYRNGFNACWQGWMRRARRGEVLILKERRRFDVEAA